MQIYTFLTKIIYSLAKEPPPKKSAARKRINFYYMLMVKLQNLISRKSVPPFQKQSFADVLQSRSSKQLHNIHRKTPALESLCNKVSVLQACNLIKNELQQRCFPVNIAKFLRAAFFH